MVCTGSIYLKELQRIVCKHFGCNIEDYKSSFGVSNKQRFCKDPIEYRFTGKKYFTTLPDYFIMFLYKYFMCNLAAEMRLRDDDNEMGYAAIGFEGSSYREREDCTALTVAKEIVGSWDKSDGKLIIYI